MCDEFMLGTYHSRSASSSSVQGELLELSERAEVGTAAFARMLDLSCNGPNATWFCKPRWTVAPSPQPPAAANGLKAALHPRD